MAFLPVLDDFANRVDPAHLNKRQIENLSAAGAFDDLNANRAAVYAGAELILSAAQSARDTRESGQGGLFGGERGSDAAQLRFADDASWVVAEAMEHEKEAFGFYFSSHPLSQFAQVSASHGARSHAEIMEAGAIPEGVRKAGDDGGDGAGDPMARIETRQPFCARRSVRHQRAIFGALF